MNHVYCGERNHSFVRISINITKSCKGLLPNDKNTIRGAVHHLGPAPDFEEYYFQDSNYGWWQISAFFLSLFLSDSLDECFERCAKEQSMFEIVLVLNLPWYIFEKYFFRLEMDTKRGKTSKKESISHEKTAGRSPDNFILCLQINKTEFNWYLFPAMTLSLYKWTNVLLNLINDCLRCSK